MFLSIAEFTYNNLKNDSIRYIFFELNYKYYLYISYKKNVNLCSRFKVGDNITKRLRDLIVVYRKNL